MRGSFGFIAPRGRSVPKETNYMCSPEKMVINLVRASDKEVVTISPSPPPPPPHSRTTLSSHFRCLTFLPSLAEGALVGELDGTFEFR